MKKLLAIAFSLFAFAGLSPVNAQQTKAALATEINTNWPDNTTGAITPALLRSTVIDIVNSYLDIFAYGSPPANSGSCGIATQTGGTLAGAFIATGSCSNGSYILALAPTAPGGWICFAIDVTAHSPTAVVEMTSTTTLATFTAKTATNDTIGFNCRGF